MVFRGDTLGGRGRGEGKREREKGRRKKGKGTEEGDLGPIRLSEKWPNF